MSTPIPGDYDPWKEVTILWDDGTPTRTWVRRSEIVGYLSNLPMERIALFSFANPKDAERGAPPK